MPPAADHPRTKTAIPPEEGAPIASAPGLVWVFPEARVTRPTPRAHRLGRGEDCDTQLPGETVSWHHAELRLVEGVLQLRDLGSRNGTRVNGHAIAEPTALRVGDVVRCGEWLGCVLSISHHHTLFGPIAPGLLGGQSLAAALEPAQKVAASGLPIVLEGPTGAGKERAAAAIHGWSGRSGEFVGVNCAAIPGELAEAELFGHSKGAYSGADRARPGYLRQADGGTLLLDEVAELPLSIQAKLLRALQEREVRPVGGTASQRIDVLLLAAAQAPFEALIARGTLREDLAARLACLTVRLPRLEQRREDIAPLFLHFLQEASHGPLPRLEPNLVEWLLLRPWPRNVRGLENLAKTMAALHGQEPTLSLRQVPESERTGSPQPARDGEEDRQTLYQRIRRALDQHQGNVSRTAATLGLDRSKVRRILKEYSGRDDG